MRSEPTHIDYLVRNYFSDEGLSLNNLENTCHKLIREAGQKLLIAVYLA